MANNYCQGTVAPFIPVDLVDVKDQARLTESGFQRDRFTEAGEDLYYYYCEDSFEIDVLQVHGEDEVDYPNDKRSFLEVFQDIIRRSDGRITEVIIHGAFTCSKMRPNEFGGFLFRVTLTGFQHADTYELIEEMRAKPEELGL